VIRSAFIGSCVFAAVAAFALDALGEPPQIAVANAASRGNLAMRLHAELEASGFRVVDVDAWSADASRQAVGDKLADLGLVAALKVTDDGTEVWIPGALGGATLRDVVRGERAEEAIDAVRTVEVVRAELRPHRASKRRLSPAVDLRWTESPTHHYAFERRSFAFDLGVGLVASPGGVPTAASATAGMSWFPSPYYGVAVVAAASPFPSTVVAAEGSSAVWTGMVGLGFAVNATDPHAALGLRIETGLGISWMHMEGHAIAPFEGGEANILFALPYARPSLRLRLFPAMAIRLDVLAGVAFPRPVIAFAGEEVAKWGQPVVVPSLGIEISP